MPTINIIQIVQGCKETMAKYWSIKMIFNYQISIVCNWEECYRNQST